MRRGSVLVYLDRVDAAKLTTIAVMRKQTIGKALHDLVMRHVNAACAADDLKQKEAAKARKKKISPPT